MRKRLEREGGIQSVKSFDSTNSLGEPGNDANLNKNKNNYGGEKNSNNNNNNNSDTRATTAEREQQQHLFDDDPDIVDEEERAERRRLRETPFTLASKRSIFTEHAPLDLRKLANRLEEKEEREKLKFQAAASLTDSERERVRTRQETDRREGCIEAVDETNDWRWCRVCG